MKKSITLITIILLLILTGCSNNKEPEQQNEPIEEIETITMPEKGKTINISGKNYLVVNTENTNALLLANKNYGSNLNYEKGCEYENSQFDEYLNNEYYESLSEDVKNAIVEKDICINKYTISFDEENENHSSVVKYDSKKEVSTIKRKVYLLDIEDIETYFDKKFTVQDLQKFFNTEFEFIPLRSSITDDRECFWGVNCQTGKIIAYYYENQFSSRPAFTIDLSKVDFSIK